MKRSRKIRYQFLREIRQIRDFEIGLKPTGPYRPNGGFPELVTPGNNHSAMTTKKFLRVVSKMYPGVTHRKDGFHFVEGKKPSLTIRPNKPPVTAKPLFMNQHALNNKPREILVVQLDSDSYADPEEVRQSIADQLDKGNVVVVDGARSVSTHIITDSSSVVTKGEDK